MNQMCLRPVPHSNRQSAMGIKQKAGLVLTLIIAMIYYSELFIV